MSFTETQTQRSYLALVHMTWRTDQTILWGETGIEATPPLLRRTEKKDAPPSLRHRQIGQVSITGTDRPRGHAFFTRMDTQRGLLVKRTGTEDTTASPGMPHFY